jgi:trk system potassium uptake protein TrkH
MLERVLSAKSTRSALTRVRPLIITAMVPIVVLAIGSLVLEYGFPVPREMYRVLHLIEMLALAGLLLEPLVGLLLAQDRSEVLRDRWFHFALAGAYLVLVGGLYAARAPAADVWALRGAHATIVLSLLVRLIELNRLLATLRVRPALLFVGSFLTLIAFGTGLLLLPVATAPGQAETGFTDALFTATSAVCVTGLTVVDTGTHWSTLGRYVVLALVQLGGLGLMTFGSIFAIVLWRGMRVRESVVMREVLSHDLLATVGRAVIFILLTTFGIEIVGAALLMGLWDHSATAATITLAERVEYSVFHSICAFCNAGFSLYRDNLVHYASAWQTWLLFPLLIIVGGIGFNVLYNFARVVRYGIFSRTRVPLARKRMSLHTKLAVVTTVCLLAGGTGLAFLFETFPGPPEARCATATDPVAAAANQPAEAGAGAGEASPPMGRSWIERLAGAWFLSTTARTAGFNTVDMARLSPPTKFLTVGLMFVGASPGSTGGGIKTVTLAVIVCGIGSVLRGRTDLPHAFRRTITRDVVLRALAVTALSAIWVAAVAMVVSAWGLRPDGQATFLDVLFETTSAFATVGLSTGTTPLLTMAGRLLIILTMFIGRVGPLTLLVAMQGRAERPRWAYPAEPVLVA